MPANKDAASGIDRGRNGGGANGVAKTQSLSADKRRGRRDFVLFVLPALLIFLNVVIIPFILGVAYSFTAWDGIHPETATFTGLRNYQDAFRDLNFRVAFGRSLLYSFVTVLLVNVVGFALALIVTSRLKTRNLLRSIYFIPNMIGGLILGFIWQFIFQKLFVQIGKIGGSSNVFFDWLQDERMAFVALIVVSVWQQAGYAMIIYIAGLQTVPQELLEAASIDGASAPKRLWTITLPLITPAIAINFFVNFATALKQYDINLSLTGGGPYGSTELVAMNIFREAYSYNNFARAQAKAVIFFLVILLISLLQQLLIRSRAEKV